MTPNGRIAHRGRFAGQEVFSIAVCIRGTCPQVAFVQFHRIIREDVGSQKTKPLFVACR